MPAMRRGRVVIEGVHAHALVWSGDMILAEILLAIDSMICDNVSLKGSVQIGDGSVIQPLCSFVAEDDVSITVGERNIVEEKCLILNSSLGHGNLIEVGTCIRNSQLGSFTRVGPNCIIESNSKIGDYCVIGPSVHLVAATIPDKTAVFRSGDGWSSSPVELNTVVSDFMLLAL